MACAAFAAHRIRGRLRRRRMGWAAPAGPTIRLPLAARVLGQGSPILLLHGLGASGRFWGAEYDRLADRHRLIVPDLLGFGRSPRPDKGYSLDDHAVAVAACLETAGVREPSVIGAHSAGSVIALHLAFTRPDLVAGIVAFGPPIYPDRATARKRVAALGGMARLFAGDTKLARTACLWVCDHRALAARLAGWARPELPPELAADGVQHSWSSYSQTLEDVVLSPHPNLWPTTAIPVVLVAGTTDPLCDIEWLQHLARLHPNVTLEHWPGGHDLPLSRAPQAADRIAALVRRNR